MRLEVSNKTATHIEVSDMSADLQHLVEVIGVELVRTLIVELGGTGNPVYIPDAMSFDKAIYRMVIKEYPNTDLRDVSFKTGISYRKLKSIMKKYRKEREIST